MELKNIDERMHVSRTAQDDSTTYLILDVCERDRIPWMPVLVGLGSLI